jgi:methionine salvage enolase-phosphatase E1
MRHADFLIEGTVCPISFVKDVLVCVDLSQFIFNAQKSARIGLSDVYSTFKLRLKTNMVLEIFE